jgi:hypothetical protein
MIVYTMKSNSVAHSIHQYIISCRGGYQLCPSHVLLHLLFVLIFRLCYYMIFKQLHSIFVLFFHFKFLFGVGCSNFYIFVCSDMVIAIFPQIQRKLQLQIEEQGQYLQVMFENQRKMEDDRMKAAASNPDDPSAPPSNVVLPSPADDKSVTLKPDQDKTGPGTSNANTIAEDSSWDMIMKQKSHEARSTEDQGPGDGDSNAPPTKRARADQTASSSTKICI